MDIITYVEDQKNQNEIDFFLSINLTPPLKFNLKVYVVYVHVIIVEGCACFQLRHQGNIYHYIQTFFAYHITVTMLKKNVL